MANRKISDLTALTAPATGDLLPIVDISEAAAADKNKKITYGELLTSAPLGSAAAPSIAFEGDINTGIYSPSADQLAISTGGTGRVFVDASGNVGVGTSGPSAYSSQFVNYGSSVDVAGSASFVNDSATADTSAQRKGLLAQGGGTAAGVSVWQNSFIVEGQAIGGLSLGSYNASGSIKFYTNTSRTERARIDTSGRLLVGVAANANGGILQLSSGITFPATAVAASNANTLDDYEEGTWTGTDASGAGLSITFNGAKYTKIGRIVYVNVGFIQYPVTASTANAAIGGLPFTNGADNAGVTALVSTNVNANRALVVASTATAFFYVNSSITPSTNVQLSGALVYGFSAVYTV